MCHYRIIAIIILGAISLPTAQLWSQQVQQGQAGTATNSAAQADASDVPGAVGTGDQTLGGEAVPGQAGTGDALETAPGNNIQFDGFNGNPWFNDMGAQEQLQINPEQYQQLLRVYQNAWARYQQGLNRLPRNLTPAQRQQRMQALQGRFYETYNRALDSTMTDPQIRQRYDQLNRQYQMFDAFNNPQLQQGMNLTPAQQRQLRQMGGRWNQQMAQLRQRADADPQADPAALNEQFTQMRAQARQQMGSVFTPQQQQMWSRNTGPNYDFPWPAYNNPAGVELYNNAAGGAAGTPGGQPVGPAGGAGATGGGAGGGAGAGGGGAGGGGAGGAAGSGG